VVLDGGHHIGKAIEFENGFVELVLELTHDELDGTVLIFVALSRKDGGLLKYVALLEDAVCDINGLLARLEPLLLQGFAQLIPLTGLALLEAAPADGHFRVKLDVVLGKHAVAAIHHPPKLYPQVHLAEQLQLRQLPQQVFLMALVILFLLRLLPLALRPALPPLALLLSRSAAVSQIVLELVAVGSLGGVGLVRGDVYFAAEVNLVRSDLLCFFVFLELVPVHHFIPQAERVAWLLLRLLLRQLQVHVYVRKVFIGDLQSFVVLVLEDFFEEGRLHSLR
jgi:hypothetical protein